MITIPIILTGLLIVFLLALSAIQSRHQRNLERKNAIAHAQSQNIIYIENNLHELSNIPVTPDTIRILLDRAIFCVDKIIKCFPRERKYKEQKQNILKRIEQNNNRTYKKSLPKAVNEKHIISMIKTLKRTISILNSELSRKSESSVVIGKEIALAEFFITYLIVNHHTSEAGKAYNTKTYGTARDRYEAALKALNASNTSLAKSWIDKKYRLCKERLALINDEMKGLNEAHVRKMNPVIHDETGLNRMMDGSKQRVII